MVGYDPNRPSVDIFVDRITDQFDGDPVTVSLKEGESADIGGTTVRFDGHSHKRTSPGQRSPLITNLTFDPDGENVGEYVSLFPPEEATWRWRNYDFRLVDWDYGQRIDLEVRRRQLRPATQNP